MLAEVMGLDASVRLPHRMTLDEFLRLPEGPPYFEFEQGEVVEVPSGRGGHQDISGNLYLELKQRIKQTGEGRVWQTLDVFLPQGRVYIPDLVYLSTERLGRYDADGDEKIHGAPDLVVEILSPGGERRDRLQKFNAYLEAAVEWYWLIDSQSLLMEEFHLEGGVYARSAAAGPGDLFLPLAFPGLEVEVDSLTA